MERRKECEVTVIVGSDAFVLPPSKNSSETKEITIKSPLRFQIKVATSELDEDLKLNLECILTNHDAPPGTKDWNWNKVQLCKDVIISRVNEKAFEADGQEELENLSDTKNNYQRTTIFLRKKDDSLTDFLKEDILDINEKNVKFVLSNQQDFASSSDGSDSTPRFSRAFNTSCDGRDSDSPHKRDDMHGSYKEESRELQRRHLEIVALNARKEELIVKKTMYEDTNTELRDKVTQLNGEIIELKTYVSKCRDLEEQLMKYNQEAEYLKQRVSSLQQQLEEQMNYSSSDCEFSKSTTSVPPGWGYYDNDSCSVKGAYQFCQLNLQSVEKVNDLRIENGICTVEIAQLENGIWKELLEDTENEKEELKTNLDEQIAVLKRRNDEFRLLKKDFDLVFKTSKRVQEEKEKVEMKNRSLRKTQQENVSYNMYLNLCSQLGYHSEIGIDFESLLLFYANIEADLDEDYYSKNAILRPKETIDYEQNSKEKEPSIAAPSRPSTIQESSRVELSDEQPLRLEDELLHLRKKIAVLEQKAREEIGGYLDVKHSASSNQKDKKIFEKLEATFDSISTTKAGWEEELQKAEQLSSSAVSSCKRIKNYLRDVTSLLIRSQCLPTLFKIRLAVGKATKLQGRRDTGLGNGGFRFLVISDKHLHLNKPATDALLSFLRDFLESVWNVPGLLIDAANRKRSKDIVIKLEFESKEARDTCRELIEGLLIKKKHGNIPKTLCDMMNQTMKEAEKDFSNGSNDFLPSMEATIEAYRYLTKRSCFQYCTIDQKQSIPEQLEEMKQQTWCKVRNVEEAKQVVEVYKTAKQELRTLKPMFALVVSLEISPAGTSGANKSRLGKARAKPEDGILVCLGNSNKDEIVKEMAGTQISFVTGKLATSKMDKYFKEKSGLFPSHDYFGGVKDDELSVDLALISYCYNKFASMSKMVIHGVIYGRYTYKKMSPIKKEEAFDKLLDELLNKIGNKPGLKITKVGLKSTNPHLDYNKMRECYTKNKGIEFSFRVDKEISSEDCKRLGIVKNEGEGTRAHMERVLENYTEAVRRQPTVECVRRKQNGNLMQ